MDLALMQSLCKALKILKIYSCRSEILKAAIFTAGQFAQVPGS